MLHSKGRNLRLRGVDKRIVKGKEIIIVNQDNNPEEFPVIK